ncbi:ferredoxin reductase family protein [Pseudonocardia asaccharolytica]|uniref:Ferric reductase n=1 Tax=Pseudonocardia asaccharolytica DSM 44247 = NBRC 16224 TaxID=1123024 RepID=A0A511D402_9PSEU|nr:ferredoxin reductase family protein [Pseudonocardia asaccharolytica]GEL19516.1 ferric reductase [Pseudonocardia asaccharolytica DSM 44247 = NBRC 16224]
MERRTLARAGWTAVLITALAGPALIWLVRSEPLSLWRQLSIVTGLVALSAMVCAAVLPSRLRSVTRVLGIENVIGVHRQLGMLTGLFVALHLACVVAADPAQVALLDVTTAPGRARAAVAGVVTLSVLLALALNRTWLGSRYELWRWLHLLFAAAALGASALHTLLLGHVLADPIVGPMLVALGCALLIVLGQRWVWRSWLDESSEFVVREVRPENRSVSTLVLEPRARHAPSAGLHFAPGQFAWLRLHRAAVEEHPFTIASGAHDPTRAEFTIRHTGDFTATLGALRPGSPVWVDGPYGAFTSDPATSAGVVMIASGVGITPMMSMLRTAGQCGDPRPFRLVVLARDGGELLFRDELTVLHEELDLEVTEVLRRPPPDWTGATGPIDVGLLTAVLAGLGHDDRDRNRLDYFICGSPSLLGDVLDALGALGVADERIHTEQFDMV